MANSSKPIVKDSRKLGVVALALAVVMFLAINTFLEAAIRGVQVDLTENQLFTLSDGTRETLGAVKEPITLRFFSTRKLVETTPGLTAYGDRVQELLERYVGLSNGTIRLELVDPEPFSAGRRSGSRFWSERRTHHRSRRSRLFRYRGDKHDRRQGRDPVPDAAARTISGI